MQYLSGQADIVEFKGNGDSIMVDKLPKDEAKMRLKTAGRNEEVTESFRVSSNTLKGRLEFTSWYYVSFGIGVLQVIEKALVDRFVHGDIHNVRSVSSHPSRDFLPAETDHRVPHLYDVNTFQCYLSANVHATDVNSVINQVGNVYVQFREEEYAAKALKNLTGRYYADSMRRIPATVVDIATFWHLKKIDRDLRRNLFGRYRRGRSCNRNRSRRIETEIENTTTRVGQGGTGAQALFIGGNVAIQKVDDIIVRFGKVVKKGVPKLSNGIGGLFSI
ncbi:cleavage stimulation factor subunit 50 isoform X2 [Tanacetum coccineum]